MDIGSGDGRIVHLAAQQGYLAHGIELNPWLVLYSRYRSLRLGLWRNAKFSRQDLWKSHFGSYPNVVIFGVEQMVRIYDNIAKSKSVLFLKYCITSFACSR